MGTDKYWQSRGSSLLQLQLQWVVYKPVISSNIGYSHLFQCWNRGFGLAASSLFQSKRWNGIAKGKQNASANEEWKSLTGWLNSLNATILFCSGRISAPEAGAIGWQRDCSWNMSFSCRSVLTVDHAAVCLCALSLLYQGMRDQFTCLYLLSTAAKHRKTSRGDLWKHTPSKPPY